jgi:hypothetical protein
MEWLLIGILTVVILILITIYRRSLRESRGLANLVVLILLDPKIHAAQSEGLANLVMGLMRRTRASLAARSI